MATSTFPVPGTPDSRVFAEQVRLLYRELPVAAFGVMLTAGVIVAGMWGHARHAWLLAWMGVVLCVLALRLAGLARFRRQSDASIDPARWSGLWLAGTAATGALIGIAGFLFADPRSLFHELLMVIVVFGLASGMVPLLSTWRPSLYWFLVPAVAPLAVRMALEGGPHLVIGVVLVVVLAMMTVLGRYYGRALERSLAIRFSNLDLIEALSEEKRRAEHAQRNAEAARRQSDAARAQIESAREAAERARAAAETANRAKTQFFAAASHDLRQPLHAMGLFAAALSEKVRDPEVRNVVDSINASVEALEALFNELLDISKIDAGVIRPRPEHFALQPMFERLQREFGPEAADRDLALRFARTRLAAHADPVLVERIIRNLVSNALRYTSTGGIVIGCRPRANGIAIEVWDTGAGIGPEHQARVFEEFWQAGNPERDRRKGLGLGLAIVQRLANLMGGKVTLRSRPGKGSVFKVELPRGTEPVIPVVVEATTQSVDLAGAHISVIDDEPSVVAGMRALLGGWGAEVIGTETIDEGLLALEQSRVLPDLLLVDYRLRDGMNGLDGIRRIRERFGTRLPAILITGNSSPDLLEHARETGVQILTKPVMPARLRALINFTLRETRAG